MTGSRRRALPGWRGRFFYREERLRTTWTLRALLLLPFFVVALTSAFWTPAVGESLVCPEQTSRSQALLVENYDPDYLVFERATTLHRAGLAPRILVPVWADRATKTLAGISKGFVELMAAAAHLPTLEMIPIVEEEPITLNVAYQLRDFLVRERITSVTVVAPGFRSRRSLLVYTTVFAPAGIAVQCVPVFGLKSPGTWTETWHGIEEVAEQFLKLQYYRFWVLL